MSQFPYYQGIIQAAKCPCNGGADPPPFVADDYFCESALEYEVTNNNSRNFSEMLYGTNNPLWNGDGCAESSTCCSRIDHPYFVKQLDIPTSDPIICVDNFDPNHDVVLADAIREDIAVEMVEISVQ